MQHLLRAAEEALWSGRLAPCLGHSGDALAACAALPAAAMPLREMRVASNLQGVALHLLGRYDAAAPALQRALELAEGAATRGLAHDQLVCVAGALNDVGVNALALGDHRRAADCIKRADYMLSRAYRPSDPARGALRVSVGLLQSAGGDPSASLSSLRTARSLLSSPSSRASRAPAAWLHAALAGAMRAALAQGDPVAAREYSKAALAALEQMTGQADPGTHLHAVAHANAAISQVEVLRAVGSGAGGGQAAAVGIHGAAPASATAISGAGVQSALAEASASLLEAATRLQQLHGAQHPEALAARESAALLAAAAERGGLPAPGWSRPVWLPAMGLGIALDGYAGGATATLGGGAAAGA
jgi:tetratricopeptide (TPR) repeat protein